MPWKLPFVADERKHLIIPRVHNHNEHGHISLWVLSSQIQTGNIKKEADASFSVKNVPVLGAYPVTRSMAGVPVGKRVNRMVTILRTLMAIAATNAFL